ncbi:MAG: 4-(cytidine 5'-diphospho)-2-C-methyl-D-erythritol kinase [Flavobacteriales bacterium]
MIFRAPAKINLGLHVKHKRQDGFHELESVFHTIPLYDYIELIPSNSDKFSSYHLDIPGDSAKNLCLKAIQLLRKKGHDVPNYEIHLLKHIPIGAGLGGGSSDAVAVIKAINQLECLELSAALLMEYAAELGSDCPFFLMDSAALVSGRGEYLTSVDFKLEGYYIHLVYPNIHISTAQAYGSLDLKQTSKGAIAIPSEESEWQNCFTNDFEKALWPKHPILEQIKTELNNSGAFFSSLSGSGSSVFGVYKSIPELKFQNVYSEWILKM